MGFRFRRDSLLGLDLGSEAGKAVEVRHGERGLEVLNVAVKPWLPGENPSEGLRRLLRSGKFKTRRAFVALSGPAGRLQAIPAPAPGVSTPEAAVGSLVERTTAPGGSRPYVDWKSVGRASSRGEELLVVALAGREAVLDLANLLSGAGVRTVGVDLEAAALAGVFEVSAPAREDALAVLDVGGNKATFVAIQRGIPLLAREIRLGTPGGERVLAEEIQTSLDYVTHQFEADVSTLWVSGGGLRRPGVDEALSVLPEVEVKTWNPSAGYAAAGVPEEVLRDLGPRLAVALGLTARMLLKDAA